MELLRIWHVLPLASGFRMAGLVASGPFAFITELWCPFLPVSDLCPVSQMLGASRSSLCLPEWVWLPQFPAPALREGPSFSGDQSDEQDPCREESPDTASAFGERAGGRRSGAVPRWASGACCCRGLANHSPAPRTSKEDH